MHAVGIKELKDRLSEYVRLAASGERVLVTDRGVVVAELLQPQAGRVAASDAMLADAVRQGWVRPPLMRPSEPPPNLPVMTLAELMRDLDADRADR